LWRLWPSLCPHLSTSVKSRRRRLSSDGSPRGAYAQ
jgi:hypothetical protein